MYRTIKLGIVLLMAVAFVTFRILENASGSNVDTNVNKDFTPTMLVIGLVLAAVILLAIWFVEWRDYTIDKRRKAEKKRQQKKSAKPPFQIHQRDHFY